MNLTKLQELFDERGYGIISDDILERAFEIFDGKHPDESVYQCSCGELLVLDEKTVQRLARKFGIESSEIPCSRCGHYTEVVLDFTSVEPLNDFLSTDYKTNALAKNRFSSLIPLYSTEESTLGLYNLVDAIRDNFSSESLLLNAEVNSFLDLAATNRTLLEDYVDNVIDFASLTQRQLNYVKSLVLSKRLLGFSLRKRLLKERDYSNEDEIVRSILAAYVAAAEDKNPLEILENLRRISNKQRAMKDPFSICRVPPKNPKGKYRNVDSLRDILDYLDIVLPEKRISSFYDTHLRNSISHNDYVIDNKAEEIELPGYNEKISFDQLRSKFNRLIGLISALDQPIIERRVTKIRLNSYEGILETSLRFDSEGYVAESWIPIGDAMPCLFVYQAWNFNPSVLSSNLSISIGIDTTKLEIQVTKQSRREFTFDKFVELWLKQAILCRSLKVKIFSVYPPFPSYLSEKRYMMPTGSFKTAAYIEFKDERVVKLEDSALQNISQIMDFSAQSQEAEEMRETNRRSKVVTSSALTERCVRRMTELQREHIDCYFVPVISSRLVAAFRQEASRVVQEFGIELITLSADLPKVVKYLHSVQGGQTTVRFRTAEGLVLAVCEVCNADAKKAIVFALHFGQTHFQLVSSQSPLKLFFSDKEGPEHWKTTMHLPTPTWSNAE